MRIGIEAERANVSDPTGVERYATEVILNLARLDQVNEYVLYFRTPPHERFSRLPENFHVRVIPFPKFWTQTRMAWELLVNPVDAFFMPIQALPFLYPKNSIITVHDLAYEMFPKAFGRFMLFYLKLTTRWGVWRARHVITVSHSTKNDVVRLYGTDPGRITVAQLGVDPVFKPRPYGEVQPVLDKYGLVYKKYILFVGSLQPRKNIIRLIEAYETLRRDHHIEEKLVIAGRKGWLWEPIVRKIEESSAKDSIIYVDYLDMGDLPQVYSGATILTLPAIYEGFGLPPLEAMASGTPVVVSNVSSMPEVVGEAGVLVDPNSTGSIAAGLLKVLVDPELQATMSKKGLDQSKKFTWENTARTILNVIESMRP